MHFVDLHDSEAHPAIGSLLADYRGAVSFALPSKSDVKYPFAEQLLRTITFALLNAASDIHLEYHQRWGFKINVVNMRGTHHIDTSRLGVDGATLFRDLITTRCGLDSSGDRAHYNAALPIDYPMEWVINSGIEVKEDLSSLPFYYLRLRVAYIRMTDNGYSFTFRLIDENRTKELHEIWFPYAVESEMRQLCNLKSGLVLTCGPVSSGKSSTQFSWLRITNDGKRKIILVEDPTEFMLHGKGSIVHIEVTKDLTPETAVEQALRMGGQVLVVGEIRSPRMMQIALTAAMTGYLVFATLHCDTTIEALDRCYNLLPDEGKEAELGVLSSVLRAVICQRLVPLREPTDETECIGLQQQEWIRRNSSVTTSCFRKASDEIIGGQAIAELLIVDYEIKLAIEENDSKRAFRQAVKQPQFETLLQQGLRLAELGKVSVDDCERRLGGQLIAGIHPTLRQDLAKKHGLGANDVDAAISEFYRRREQNIPSDIDLLCEKRSKEVLVCAA